MTNRLRFWQAIWYIHGQGNPIVAAKTKKRAIEVLLAERYHNLRRASGALNYPGFNNDWQEIEISGIDQEGFYPDDQHDQ